MAHKQHCMNNCFQEAMFIQWKIFSQQLSFWKQFSEGNSYSERYIFVFQKIHMIAYACIYILTYRNNTSYMPMVILIFLSVRPNTDQILMK